MDITDGRLYPYEEAMRNELVKKFCVAVPTEDLTAKQVKEQRVSLHDHRSKAGVTLTKLRGVGRNEPCPCGSGKKFKFCHLNV